MPPDLQPEIRQLLCGEISLCVGIAGAGRPVLFIGGTGWDLRAAQTPLHSPLTRHYRLALFDQRGQGRSDKPPGPYSMKGYAKDALALVDALGWDRPDVIGYSFGGMVAQEYAILFPDRLDRLILASCTSGGKGGSSFPIHSLLDLPAKERAHRSLEVADLRFSELSRSDPRQAQIQLENRMASQTRFLHETDALAGLRAQLAARAQHDCFDRLGQITAPTLVLGGTYDGQAPLRAQERMSHQIPDAVFVSVPGTHNFIAETEAGYQEMLAFLNRDRP